MTQEEKLIQEIVIARLNTMPSNIGISIGNEGEFSKKEIIDHVKNNDKIGKKMIEIQMSYLKSLKNLTDYLIPEQHDSYHTA